MGTRLTWQSGEYRMDTGLTWNDVAEYRKNLSTGLDEKDEITELEYRNDRVFIRAERS